MRIAVTGGAGYIGSILVKKLLEGGYKVATLDNQSTGNNRYLRPLKTAALEIIEGDIRNPLDLDRAFKNADAVVHAAALSDLDTCNEKPEEAVSVNIYGTYRLLEAALRNSVRRIVFCSSAAVYGVPKTLPVTERDALHPLNLYGITKLTGEKLIESCHLNNGMETVCLRFGNVYGVGLYTNWIGVIPKFVSLGVEGKPLTIYGDGSSTRDFVHIEDIIQAITLSITTKGIKMETLNIGSETTNINEVADIVSQEVKKAMNKSVPLTHLPPRQGETKEFSYDTSRIRRVLGFEPRWKLVDGIKQIVQYRLDSQRQRI
jgi:UDP-glucose 4-epimerase